MTKYLRPLMTLAAIAIAGCAPTKHTVMRNEMQLQGNPQQTKDGLTLTAKVFDLASAQKDARLNVLVNAQKKTSLGMQDVQVNWVLFTPPVFEIRASNQSGHVIKFTGAVFKLIDSTGNVYDALPRDVLISNTQSQMAAYSAQGVQLAPTASGQVLAKLKQVKILDDNTQLLPDIAETLFLIFNIPGVASEDDLNKWLANQTTLRLKIFEVPVEVNQAGAVTKRTAFEFPVVIKTVNDTYEVDMLGGKKQVGSQEVAK